MKKEMENNAPSLNLETIRVFLPGWHEELMRTGSIGRPTERVVFGEIYSKTTPVLRERQHAMVFTEVVLRPHFYVMDTLSKLILLEDGLAAFVKKHKRNPSDEEVDEVRHILGLESAIGSA